jgi:tetraacyldisaccharide 4'-kinase
LTLLRASGYNVIPGNQAPADRRQTTLHEPFHDLIRGTRKGPVAACQRLGLWLMSQPYGAAVRVRNWAYDLGWRRIERVPAAVVSVGNLTAGGTGKTPCVEMVARFYRRLGLRVAILSRGYGSRRGGTAAGANDEARVLEQNLPDVPHLQGADRAALARVAVAKFASEVLILDDGLQHRRLWRDLELVLIDATNPWGHGHLLPRGLLREPIAGLRRADVVLMTRCDLVSVDGRQEINERVQHIAPGVPMVETAHEPAAWQNASGNELPPKALAGRVAAAFCGIGNPDGFRRTLVRLGVHVVAWRTFRDHHNYAEADLEELRQWAGKLPAETVLVTTQKDLVKIGVNRLGERELWSLRIHLRVMGGLEDLEERLRAIRLPGERLAKLAG